MKRSDPRMRKPYIRLGRPNDKGFNTDTVAVYGKVGVKCLNPAWHKDTVNQRHNRETFRRKLLRASFIPVPRLVKHIN